MKIVTFLIAGLLLLATHAAGQTKDSNATTQGPQAAQAPKPVKDIVYAQPFTLAKGYVNHWSKERELVSSGILVVLDVDPALVEPRDALEPILYAGNKAIQRLNHGEKSGRVIGIVPGVTDLTGSPIWFGTPGLPERITAETVRAERAQAEKSGIRPFASEKLQSVVRPSATAADLAALLRDQVSALVIEYSPQEKDLAETWRLPVAKAPPKQHR